MPEPAPALKEIFNAACFRRIAADSAALCPSFDSKRFLALGLNRLDELTLLQRLRRVTESLHATLPGNYARALKILYKLAPQIDSGLVSLFLPDFVGLYGQKHFEESMVALKFFTPFGSSEFGIRPFLQSDLHRTLKVMKTWSRDNNEHVRRLASEGCRPRLPWAGRLDALVADPSPTEQILNNLRADPSLYVRKSVANHLNDISKDHPAWMLDRIGRWDLENEKTAWIVKHALRSLIKAGNRQALTVLGAGRPAQIQVKKFLVAPEKIQLGETVTFTVKFSASGNRAQKLILDYVIHYVKKSKSSSAKVFKWKELHLEPGQTLTLSKRQTVRDFSTRKHQAGVHRVELVMNGAVLAESSFELAL